VRIDVFPAPREDDCRYGCCKAGDVGISSEVVRVGHRRLWAADQAELDYALVDLRAAWWAVVTPALEPIARRLVVVIRALIRH